MIQRIAWSLRQGLSQGVLLVLWALVVTPVALLARLVRGDVLGRPDPDADSYWESPDDRDVDGLVAFFASRGKLWLLPVVLLLLALGLLLVLSESGIVLAFLYPLS